MSISYANVVATGSTTPEPTHVEPVEAVEQLSKDAIATASTEEPKEQTQLPSPDASPKAEKAPPKVLAPAPVPEVSAWSSAPSSRSNSNVASTASVDEKHWPAPTEILQVQQQQQSPAKKIVASKTSKEKWVPFKASVVLPQPGKKQNNQHHNNSNQKKNNAQKNVLNQNNKQQQPFSQDSKKRKNKPQEKQRGPAGQQVQQPQQPQKKESPKDEKPVESKDATDVTSQEPSTSIPSADASFDQTTSQAPHHHNHNSAPHHHNQYHNNASNYQHYNNNSIQPPHPRHANGFQPQQFTPQGQPFYPGQYVPGQRQFRPYNRRFNNGNKYQNNGAVTPNGTFRPHNGNFIPGMRRHNFNRDEPLFSLTKQIEYYFSVENLVKDIFMRKQMNEEGWLNVSVIANFYRMQVLSNGDFATVKKAMDELNGSLIELAEFEGDDLKVRVKENFATWVLPVEQRDENGKDGKKLVSVVSPKEKETETTDAVVVNEVAKEEEEKSIEA